MISDGLDGKRGLRIDHVREREISRGRDVAFAAGKGKILLLNFCLVGSEKQGRLPAIFSKNGDPMLPDE